MGFIIMTSTEVISLWSHVESKIWHCKCNCQHIHASLHPFILRFMHKGINKHVSLRSFFQQFNEMLPPAKLNEPQKHSIFRASWSLACAS